MRLCNDVITVFNASFDRDTDADVYLPTVIKGVSWYNREITSVDHSGLKAANTYTVRVPMDADFGGKSYVDPVTYASLTDRSGVWTLKAGDMVVKSAVTDTHLRPSDLTQRFADAMTILTVTDNRRAPNAPHWRITGA